MEVTIVYNVVVEMILYHSPILLNILVRSKSQVLSIIMGSRSKYHETGEPS